MNAPAQRATLVLEHVSVTDNVADEKSDKPWSLVAYLIYDSGQRDRATLFQCETREEAAECLKKMWGTLTG